MIEYEEIHHVSLVVKDLEKAKAFYSEVLGLKEISRPDFGFPGAWFAIGSQQLHLIVHSESQTSRDRGGIDTRDGHFAVRVKDYHHAIQHLEKLDIPYEAKPDSRAGFAQIFCCDPDGNIIEMNVA